MTDRGDEVFYVVTGGGGGIGRVVAAKLAERARVVVLDRGDGVDRS